jgi:hypothetical protein
LWSSLRKPQTIPAHEDGRPTHALVGLLVSFGNSRDLQSPHLPLFAHRGICYCKAKPSSSLRKEGFVIIFPPHQAESDHSRIDLRLFWTCAAEGQPPICRINVDRFNYCCDQAGDGFRPLFAGVFLVGRNSQLLFLACTMLVMGASRPRRVDLLTRAALSKQNAYIAVACRLPL